MGQLVLWTFIQHLYICLSLSLSLTELRDSFKLHDYDMDGKIFAADVGAVIRAVPGLKPSQHEIEEIKAIMDQRGMSPMGFIIYSRTSPCGHPTFVETPPL